MVDTSDVPESDHPFAPVDAFRAALSAGDGPAVIAAHVDGEVTILDNVPPFIWSGAACVSKWLTDMATVAAHRGLTDQNVTYGSAITELIDGDSAYGIYPATWSYRERDVPRSEHATIAFALRRTPIGWKISGWSWNPVG